MIYGRSIIDLLQICRSSATSTVDLPYSKHFDLIVADLGPIRWDGVSHYVDKIV